MTETLQQKIDAIDFDARSVDIQGYVNQAIQELREEVEKYAEHMYSTTDNDYSYTQTPLGQFIKLDRVLALIGEKK